MRRVPHCLFSFAFYFAVAVLALSLASAPALARGHDGSGFHGGPWHGGGWHGGWHGGAWYHPGFHYGFYGRHPVIAGGVRLPFAYPYYNPYDYDAPGAWPYAAPLPVYAASAAGQCRTFQGNALVAGSNQPFYGQACLQPDGRWHIIP